MDVREFWLVVILAGFYFQAEVLNSQNITCNSRDLSALLDLINNLETVIGGWDTNSSTYCCNWTGITCDPSSSGRVTNVELGKRRLVGSLPDSIGNLDELRVLNLSQNSLKGKLPYSLFQLPKLELLNLSSNDFSGQIPQSVNLPSIQKLDISSNSINGSLPSHICANSTRIEVLSLSVNYFSGNLPPGFGSCTSLQQLCIGMNDLRGGISEDIFQLQNLSLLGLQNNRLSGELNAEVGNLSNLVRLDISFNNFTGRLPDVFGRMGKLQYVVAHSNNFIGTIPSSLSNSPTLNLLNLRNNSLEGPLDLNCSALVSFSSLDLGSNKFVGQLPDDLPTCRMLKNVNLARNKFTGSIPDSFRNFHSLSYLSLSNCSMSNISSALQTLQQCRNLTTLVLTMNFYEEALPAESNLQFEKLKVLVIANCRLTGSVPSWLSYSSSSMQLLDLSWNRLSGTIPAWLGSFERLFYLDLSNNSFVGEIPKSLTGLQSLINRSISLEEPSPDFPFFMKRNESARGLQYNQIWRFPPLLDFSANSLNGTIWPEFANLKKLNVFDLHSNRLFGQIPASLSGMTSLEALDLSENLLSGPIPPSLESLSFISTFSVAHNRLSGKIPSGGQFPTFPNSSFEGNSLCGDHRLPCTLDPSVNRNHGSSRRSKRNTNAVVGMSVGIVVGIAFLVALMCLIILRVHNRGEVDPEKDDLETRDVDEVGSRLVVLFHNKENYRDLCLDDLMGSTNNFDQANIVGCGGFGLVYKAILQDGRKLAIKKLSGDCGQMEREFRAEVETLSQAQHPNLVHLQGYCMHKNDRLLIYSYMENGSLDYWLHEKFDGRALLDWETRLQIAQGAARGLAYLHQSCEPRIVHRDVKSSNILLNEKFVAHLADFGLARLLLPYDTHVTTDLVGTLGYIPPEYGQASVATYKGDVYSFGVVLLELLTGKRPMDMCKPKGSRDMISWVIQMKNESRESEVFDPFIYDEQHDEQLLRILEIACLCLSQNPKVRPTMQQLVSWLDNIDAGEKTSE